MENIKQNIEKYKKSDAGFYIGELLFLIAMTAVGAIIGALIASAVKKSSTENALVPSRGAGEGAITGLVVGLLIGGWMLLKHLRTKRLNKSIEMQDFVSGKTQGRVTSLERKTE